MFDSTRILLIEDDPGDVDLIQELLALRKDVEYEFASVNRISAALDILRSITPDIILLAVNLAHGEHPTKVIKRLCEAAPEVPCLVLSEIEDPKSGCEAIKAGAQDFLSKRSLSGDVLFRSIYYAIERNRTRLSLKKSEETWRTALDSITTHIAILNESGKVLTVNKAWSQFSKKCELVGGSICINEDYLALCRRAAKESGQQCEQLAEGIERVLQGIDKHCELELSLGKEGEDQRWFFAKVTSVIDWSGGCVIVTHEDITHRKRPEQKRLGKEGLLNAVYDNSPNLIGIKDDGGRYVSVNAAFCHFYDVEKDEVLGKNAIDLAEKLYLTEDEAGKIFKEDIRVIKDWKVLVKPVQSVTGAGGGKRWIKKVKTPIRLSDGRACSLGIAVDVTEQHEMEIETRNSEIRLRTILDNLKSKVVLLDNELRVVWPNKVACDQVTLSRAEIVGRYCYDVWRNGHRACSNCPAVTSINSHKANTTVQTLTDGRTWRITGCPVNDSDGRLAGVVEVSEDITERKQLESQIRQSQKMESLGTLAGGIAHDFNNILTAILGFTGLSLNKIETGSELYEDLKEVYLAGVRAKDLVNQILTFSRRGETEQQPLQVRLVVKEVLKLLRSSLPTSIEFKQLIDSGEGLVAADPTQIHQVVMNLCTNAAQAMGPGGGELKVEVDEYHPSESFFKKHPLLNPGDYLRLRVSDTGCGMSPEVMSSIFDPYFTTRELGEGTGLGLSVVHGIVSEGGGDISVDSQVGNGSTFTIVLPLCKGGADRHIIKHREEKPLPQGSEHLMVVDDEPPILAMSKRILEQNGYKVSTYIDSTLALADVKKNPKKYDLVISDVTMPKMTGDKLAEALIKIEPDLPIVLMTGYSNIVSEDMADQLGIIDVLYKPLGRATLVRMVRKYLDDAIRRKKQKRTGS